MKNKVELNIDEYERLKKDASDNRSVMRIAFVIIFVAVCIYVYVSFGQKLLDISVQRRQAQMQNDIAIEEAQTNAKVREIEQGNLTNDEYFEWLRSRSQE